MNSKTRRSFLIAAVLTTVVPTIDAETFHVARQEPGASDSNDGLSPIFVSGNHGPWRTLSHAGETVVAGDRVLVYNGDYRDEPTGYGTGVVAIESSGSREAPIELAAATGQSPVVNTLYVEDKQWIEVRGFSFVSRDFELPVNWRDMPEIVIDDPNVVIDPDEPWSSREAKVRQKYATYMEMHDFFYSAYTTGIDLKRSSHIVIANNSFSLYSFGIQVRAQSSHILIENNHISYCADAVATWDPVPSIADSIIRGNVLRQNFNGGISVRDGATNVIVEGNDVQFSGTSHISVLGGCSKTTVLHNSGQYGGYYSETMQFPGSTAINVHTSSDGIVVDGNYAAYQIDLTGNDGNGYIADLMLNGAGVLFRNNVAYRNMGSGIRMVHSPNCVVVNNTLVENGYGSSDPRDGAGVHLSQEDDLGQVVVNNVFFNNPTAGIKSFEILDRQKRVDHNLYYSEDGAPLIWDGYEFGDDAYYSLSEIQQNTPWETHGVEGDPLFVDTGLANFRLMLASPAVDVARTIKGVARDFDSRRRPRGDGYDIGAFESH